MDNYRQLVVRWQWFGDTWARPQPPRYAHRMTPPTIDPDGLRREEPTPVYRQLADLLRRRIATGEWPANHRLQTEPALARDLGVSRGTLRKALEILIGEGLLKSIHGRGTFVLPRGLAAPLGSELGTISEELAKQGIDFTTAVLAQAIVAAPAEVASALGLARGARVLRLERLRSDADGPIALLLNYVGGSDYELSRLEAVDFAARPLFEALEADLGWPLSYGRRTVDAVAATEQQGRRLAVGPGRPLLLLEQVTYVSDGTGVEYSHVWINPARMRVSSVVERHPRTAARG